MRLKSRKFCIVFSLFVCSIFFIHRFPRTPNPNEYSRIYQIRSIVETGHLYLDEMIEKYGHLMDKSRYMGHYYSDKSFGLTLIGVPFYAVYHFIFGSVKDNEWLKYFLSIFCVALPNMIFLYFFYMAYIEKHAGRSFKELSVIAYMIGTIVFTYSALFYSHVTGSVLCAMGFMLIDRKISNHDFRFVPLLGLFLGLAVIVEFPLALICLWLTAYAGIYVLSQKKYKSVLSFSVCFIMPVLLQLYVNYLSFGNPFSLGYAKKSSVEQVYYHSHGLFGVALPTWESFWGILISPSRGLFYFSPVLIFIIPILIKMIKKTATRLQGIIITGILCTYTFFAASVFDWQAGWTVGPRYYLPVIPFILIGLVKGEVYLRQVFKSKHRFFNRFVFLSLVIFGMLHCIIITSAFPFVPEAFKVPFWEFSIPLLKKGYGSLSLVCLLGVDKRTSVILFSGLVLLLVSVTFFLKFRLYNNKKFFSPFICSCLTAFLLIMATRFLPESDVLKKAVKMEYLYSHWKKPVDQLEQLYIITNADQSYFDYKVKLADTLKKLGFYHQARIHYKDILKRSPSNVQVSARIDVIDNVLESGHDKLKRIKILENSLISKDDLLNALAVLIRHGFYKDAEKLIESRPGLLNRKDKVIKQALSAVRVIKKYDVF